MQRSESVFRAVASGIRAQWTRRAPNWPPLFDAVAAAPRCLTGLLKLRAAATDEDARELYDAFELRLCASLDQPRVQWPSSFGRFASRPPVAAESVRSLPRIAPEQALVLLGPLHHLDGPAADLYAAALETSFGEDATWPVPDETMLRLLTPHVPTSWRASWTQGFGLEPPAVFKSPAEAATKQALADLAAGRSIQGRPRGAVEIAFTFATLAVGAALDASGVTLTRRAA